MGGFMISIPRPHRLAAGVFVLAALTQAADYSTWSRYRDVTVSTAGLNLSAPVKKIPLLVRFKAADHADMFTGASSMLAGGADIRVTKADGTTDVPFEIEQATTGANGSLVLWVLADSVGQNATNAAKFRVFWGKAGETSKSNGAAVFDTANGYRAVYHMNGGTSQQEKDATEMANHMAASDSVAGSLPGTVPGVIGSARDVAGDSAGPAGRQYFVAPNTASKPELNWGPNNPHTISAWVYAREFHNVYNQYGHGSSIFNKGDKQYALQAYGDTNNRLWEGAIYANANNGWRQVKSKNKAQEGEWVYLATTWSGGANGTNGTGKLYINGVLDSTIALEIGTGTS